MTIEDLWLSHSHRVNADDSEKYMDEEDFKIAILEWESAKTVSRVELPVMQKIAGIRWENRYSETLDDDKMGRWMRIGRINGMTVAIVLKAKERFLIKLPNNKGDESLENHIIATDLGQGMLEAEKYIAKYVSNFSA